MKVISIISMCLLLSGPAICQNYNVVWLVAEDQSAQFFPMYGDETIELPALEALAKESVIYENAFATAPVCAPARSSIILGMHPMNIGTHNMRTYNAYKKDNEPSIGIPSYSPVVDEGVVEFPKYLRAKGYYCSNNAKEDYNMKITDGTWDESAKGAHWRGRTEGQPFFSVFNFNDCHESGIWRYGEDSLYVDPADVPVPPYFPDDPVIRHDLAVNYSNMRRIDDKIQVLIDQLKEDGVYDNTFIFFYGDHGGPFPRHKRSLRDSGLKVPFFVKVPKNFNRGLKRQDELVSFVDLAPTVLSIAGIKKPDNMQGRAFLGDHVTEPEASFILASSDRYDATLEHSRAIRSKRYKLIINHRPDLPYAIPVSYREQMLMMKRLRAMDEAGELEGDAALWMREVKDSLEFFDLVNDPYELNNLAGNPFYSRDMLGLMGDLVKWEVGNYDHGQVKEKELIKQWAFVRSSTLLKSPIISERGDELSVHNPNKLGNIVFQPVGEVGWKPYNVTAVFPPSTKFKVVHIGLADSEIAINN